MATAGVCKIPTWKGLFLSQRVSAAFEQLLSYAGPIALRLLRVRLSDRLAYQGLPLRIFFWRPLIRLIVRNDINQIFGKLIGITTRLS